MNSHAQVITDGQNPIPVSDSLSVYRSTPIARLNLVRGGIPAVEAKALLAHLDIPQAVMLGALRLPVATLNRKAKAKDLLSPEESERIVAVSRLIGQVTAMVNESGVSEDFDPSEWLSDWLQAPLPAFGGERPIAFLDTMEGFNLVSNTLSQMQSGAYA